MATKRVWMGSVGPFEYDDTDQYDPENGDTTTLAGVRVEGNIWLDDTPTDPTHAARVGNVTDAVDVAAASSFLLMGA